MLRKCGWIVILVALGRVGYMMAAEEVEFQPLAFPQGNTENRTGTWLSCNVGDTPAEILPLKTRMWATRDSVTDGVALKCVFEPGSRAMLSFENVVKPPVGSAGFTLYAKASRPLKLKVQGEVADVGMDWKKLDFPWAELGATPERPDLGQFLTVAVAGPITKRTWLILDRIGTETPAFDPKPKIDPQPGPDPSISSKDILYGAEHLAKALKRVQAKRPFKMYVFGDSITLGFQMSRGTEKVQGADGVPFLYHHHLARLWEEAFGYKGITVVHGGQPGALRKWHQDNIGPFLAAATPDDLVILNLSLDGVAGWKEALRPVIVTAKTRTDQIIIMSPTAGASAFGCLPEMTAVLTDLVREEKVAAADILKFMTYRGEKYCWAGEGDEWHPTYMLQIMMGEMMAPLLTGKERVWPEGTPAKVSP